MGNGPPWEMDPPEHIHGHLLGGSISHATALSLWKVSYANRRWLVKSLDCFALNFPIKNLNPKISFHFHHSRNYVLVCAFLSDILYNGLFV